MVNSKIKIHNNFDITVISSDNKEVNYKAYNTVTNNLRKELIRFTQNGTSSAFDNMVVGSGTGEPSITDTKLFNPLSYYTATKEEYGVLDDNTCWCRYKIIIEPGDLVGKTITEVGMGSTSTIYTHAMIKDSQGNEVGIYKTDTDKLIIRSTVYMTLNTPSYTQPHGTIRYGQNHIPQYFAWLLLKRNNPSSYGNYFECHAYKPLTTDTCPRSGKGTNTTSKTYDNTNYIGKYQMDITTTQFNNLYIHSLVWNSGYRPSDDNNYGHVTFPINKIGFTGTEYVDVSVGTGDGSTTMYKIPPVYRNNKSMTVKINGVETNDYSLKKAWCIDSQMAFDVLHDYGKITLYKSPVEDNVYYRLCTNYFYNHIGSIGIDKLQWDNELQLLKRVAPTEGSTYEKNASYSSIRDIIMFDDGVVFKGEYYEYDFINNKMGNKISTNSLGTNNNLVPFKIEGTDKYLVTRENYGNTSSFTSYIYSFKDNKWVQESTMSSYSLMWTNKTNSSLSYVGNMILRGYPTYENSYYHMRCSSLGVWDTITQTYKNYSMPNNNMIGFIAENKGVSYNSTTQKITIHTFDESYNELSKEEIPNLTTNAARCLWLGDEGYGVIVTAGGTTISYDEELGEYITTSQKVANSNSMKNSESALALVVGKHPVSGYLGHYMHIDYMDSMIVFNNPPAEGDVITIDVHANYLYKTEDMICSFTLEMQC